MTTPALSIRHLGKTFPGQVALRDVSFDVAAGEVHALVGENGCGKSTLIKSLSGYHQPDPGSEIEVAGAALPMPHSPRQAREVGLAFVHQDLGLIETASVLENLAYGHGYEVAACWRIKWRAEQRIARELLEEFEVPVRPNAVVGDLSQANKTLVAIVRGLRDAGDGGRVLVLDEPTAALPESEASRLFDFVRRLQKRGLAIIYVSHRLNEVFEICQKITVLRDAGLVGTFDAAELDERSLVRQIIGKSLAEYVPKPRDTVRSEVLLEVEGIWGPRLREVSFKVAKGEIVGIAGLLGSGRS
ncbi:MAG: sugar ABC transporter ATP-binding protein, partial [Actinobacteria bacterium]|nr:sugar ABC transporter ATP-binding protein [Actinomycetota bacterium]